MNKFYCLLSTLLISYSVNGQQKGAGWNIEKPGGPSKVVSITTDEGTWMNVDVSPDGKEIVFDLLGDIYKMPVGGGRATLLAGGLAFEVQPRFSPNGKYISYTSDKNGGNNIWIMKTDGTGKRQVSNEAFQLLNNAAWTPDNQFLIARKNFGDRHSAQAGELWMYHISGGEGVQLTQRKNNLQDTGEPAVSADGRFVYFSQETLRASYVRYNKDPNKVIYEIKRLNRETGDIETVAGGAGGAVRPQPSPDGRLLAFVKRVRLKTVLYIQDLSTGEEWPVYDDLSRDLQEASSIFGVYPGFAWTPDSKNIIFYAKGKIRKLDISSQIVNEIPFEATTNQVIAEALHFDQPVFNDEFDVKMIRQLTTSPDNKMVAFHAAGFVYIKELPNGQPKRITQGTDFEYEPEFSPDGKSLIYVSWNDENKGSIHRMDLKTGAVSVLTSEKGFYYSPKFSNKGDKIVYCKGGGNNVLGYTFGKNQGIYIIPANGGNAVKINDRGTKPIFNATDNRIFFQETEGGKKIFKSIDLNGGSERTHYVSAYVNQFVPSPDGRWLAFTELFNAYVTPLVSTANGIDLSASNQSLPLTKVTDDVGSYVHWSRDSKRLNWTLGSQYFSHEVKNTFSFAEGASATDSSADNTGIELGLKLTSDVPTGKIAFTNARIITMKGNEVIENGNIIVEKNRITAIGPATKVPVPQDATVINADNQTIIPGFIDVHNRLPINSDGICPQQNWAFYANLAYGVTTVNDPESNMEMLLNQAEMVRAGRMTGPRLYSSGTIFYGGNDDPRTMIRRIEDARAHLKRIKAGGALLVRTEGQPGRDLRQQLVQAAREFQMEALPGDESSLFYNLTTMVDGYTGVEHNIPVVPIYKDVKQLFNGSKAGYTPMLIVSSGAQRGENFWYDRTNVWEKERLLNFIPRPLIDAKSRRRTTSEFGDYGHIEISKAVKQIADGGTRVNLGSNGQLQGLGSHWELWMLAQGGMTPLEAIRCATINGAQYLGINKEVGSLETGKLADLIVLDGNPLDDIRNTENIRYVMCNGRLFNAETMNEEGNRPTNRAKFWWQTLRGESTGFSGGDESEGDMASPEN